MAMTFEFNIRPFGYQNDPIPFGRMRVHSAGAHHEYSVDYKTKDGWKAIRGIVPKVQPDGTKRSGHRNFLHLLSDILADVDLEALGSDYVHILAEIEKAHPHIKDMGISVGDYPDD